MEIVWREGWSLSYHIHRYKKIVERAIKHRKVCYFWFHPSMDSRCIDLMKGLFDFIVDNKDNLAIMTTKDYVEFINHRYN